MGSGGDQIAKSAAIANPFFLDKPRFQPLIRAEHGNLRVLDKVPNLGRYRFSILVLHPYGFSAPHHNDADVVFFIAKGKATVSLSFGDHENSTNLHKGDIFRTPIGTSVYIINTDGEEELHVYSLLQTVSPSGDYCNFIGAAGEDPFSLYKAFSDDILEAIFNVPMSKIEKVLGAQKKGPILKATEEQVKVLSSHSFASTLKCHKPFNLLNKKPTYSNSHGKLFEAGVDDCDLLGLLDADISYTVIIAGSIMAPFHNTKASSVTMVIGGTGYFEVLYPKLTSHGIEYGKVRSEISTGTGFVVPTCFPVVIVADAGEDLELLSFGLNAKNNTKFYLAGKNNIFNRMKNEAKELSFDVPVQDINEVFDAQDEFVFFPGPAKRTN